jgi:hypothetical protein
MFAALGYGTGTGPAGDGSLHESGHTSACPALDDAGIRDMETSFAAVYRAAHHLHESLRRNRPPFDRVMPNRTAPHAAKATPMRRKARP